MRRPRHEVHEALDDYVTRLHATGATIEDLVGEDSEDSVALGPLLQLADLAYRELRPGGPSESFVQSVEVRLLNQLRHGAKQPAPRRARPSYRLKTWRFRRAAWVMSLLLTSVLLLGSVGLVQASAATLPGDGLYPVKRGIEETRLALTFASSAEARLLGEFSDERVREIEGLLEAGRTQDLNAAVEAYLATLERYCASADQADPDAGYSESQGAQDKIGHNIEVLQSLLAKLPAKAQAAVQRAIDRSLDHKRDMETKLQNRDLQQAEQISRKYGPSVEDAFKIYDGNCDQKWNCVREYYREGGVERAPPHP